MSFFPGRLTRKLSFKQARVAVLVAVLLGCVSVAIQIRSDLVAERARVAAYGAGLLSAVTSSFSRAAYRMDNTVAGELAAGILKDPAVLAVSVVDDFGDVLAEVQKPRLEAEGRSVFSKLVSSEPVLSRVPLVVQPEDLSVGHVEVAVDPVVAAEAFSQRSWLVISSGMTKSMVLSVVLTLIFYLTVTRRIERMAKPFQRNGQVVHNRSGDELDDLRRAIDAWREEIETAEKDLRRAAERLLMAEEAAKLGVWVWRFSDEALEWDEGICNIFGITPADFEKTVEAWFAQIHPEDLPSVSSAIENTRDTGASLNISYRTLPDGENTRIIRSVAEVEADPAGRPCSLVGVSMDVSSEEKLRAQLETSRRLESLGALSAGVAHDFNNTLAVLLGNLEIARDSRSDAELNECLDDAIRACAQGKALTSRLLAYGRRSPLHPESADVNKVLEKLVPMLQRTLPARIDMATDLGKDLPRVLVDRGLLETSILNLVINARDAIASSGRILIASTAVTIEPHFETDDLGVGWYVRLTVEDNGSGISTANMTRVFDPFFSTKEFGRGHGMGLSMVRGFVEQSGGVVRVYSDQGLGTALHLYFPVSEDVVEAAGPPAPGYATALKAGLCVLVAEDNEHVLRTVMLQLSHLGAKPIPASSGQAALELIDKGHPIDVVLTDVVMPGKIQGLDLARILKARAGAPPVICMSGYDGRGVLSVEKDIQTFDILQKPVSKRDLEDALRRACHLSLGTGPTAV